MSPLEGAARDALACIPPGSVLLAAVSGGADSTALLRVLAGARKDLEISLVACHVDHGIRVPEENDADTRFVEDLCRGLHVPFIVKSMPYGSCAARARARSQGIEETARDMRHELLREAAREAGACAIALGHTRDDEVETILMRVLQGSDVEGLRGIPFRRGPFVRPLLGCTRAQILAYLASLGQDWRDDPSNAETVFYRNKVRHLLLPLLAREFPNYTTGVLNLSRKCAFAADAIRQDASRLPWRAEEKGFSIEAGAFLEASPAVRIQSLLILYDQFREPGSPRRLPWRFLNRVLTLRRLPSRGTVLNGHGAALFSRKGRLFWTPRIASRGKKGYFIEVSWLDHAVASTGDRTLVFDRVSGRGKAATGGVFIREDEMKPPLVLRSKRKGDRILLENGDAPVKDLMTEWQVPEAHRSGISVLADRRGVLAVLGFEHGVRVRAGAAGGGTENGMHIHWETNQGRGT